jgi:hypothetical protein
MKLVVQAGSAAPLANFAPASSVNRRCVAGRAHGTKMPSWAISSCHQRNDDVNAVRIAYPTDNIVTAPDTAVAGTLGVCLWVVVASVCIHALLIKQSVIAWFVFVQRYSS